MDGSSLVDLKKEAVDVSKLLVNLHISKINRMGNKVAHKIAKFSFGNRSDGIIFHYVPPCVAKFVYKHFKLINTWWVFSKKITRGKSPKPTQVTHPLE